jgi:hypothetical protein
MIGWYFDVLVGYLIRILSRTIRFRGSGRWPAEKAKVTGSRCEGAVYGGPVAEVTYTFTHKGEYCSGMHREPFLSRVSAERYTERFPEGGDIVVRVKPGEPEISIVCDDDQSIDILN